jgi:hypothetical protein
MARVFGTGAMAGGFAAAQEAEGERAGQQIVGDAEAAEEFELALAEAGGLRTFRGTVHLMVTIPLEIQKRKRLF